MQNISLPPSQKLRNKTLSVKYVMLPLPIFCVPNNKPSCRRSSNLEPTKIDDHSAFLIFERQLSKNWKVTAQTAYFDYKQIGSSLWPTSLDAQGNLQRAASIWDATNKNYFGQVFANGNFATGSISHKVLVGLDAAEKKYLADWSQNYDFTGTQTFNIYNPVHGLPKASVPVFDRSKDLKDRAVEISQRYAALYLQDELGFLRDQLRLTLAGRYTRNRENSYGTKTNDGVFTPRVGLSYSIDKNTSVYALYDQAFVPQPGVDINNKNLDPITGNNIEAGIKKDWFDGRWNSSVSLYRITKNNMAIAVPDATYYVQLGQYETQGVEVDVRGEIFSGLSLVWNYAYTDAEITKDSNPENIGNAVPGSTKHVTNGWLSYKFKDGSLKGVGISTGYQWQVKRSSWFVFDGSEKSLPDYFRLDGAVSWQNNKYHLALNINNILDDYLYSGSPYGEFYYWQTEPPRNFRISLGYKF